MGEEGCFGVFLSFVSGKNNKIYYRKNSFRLNIGLNTADIFYFSSKSRLALWGLHSVTHTLPGSGAWHTRSFMLPFFIQIRGGEKVGKATDFVKMTDDRTHCPFDCSFDCQFFKGI